MKREQPRGARPGKVTIKDIAERAGVSTAAVGYALNGNPGVSEATRARVLSIAQDLGYVGNPHARSLRTGRSKIIGLVIRDLENPYFLGVIAGAQQVARQHGMSVLAMDSDGSPELEVEHVQRLAELSAEGLAIAPTGGERVLEVWEKLSPGTPVVLLNVLSAQTSGYVTVSSDRPVAIEAALRHLTALGHTRIGFLELASSVLGDTARREIFEGLVHAFGVVPRVIEVPMKIRDVRDVLIDVLGRDDRPTAVIANSDHYALAVYEAARHLGLRIGVDLSVIGQDDLPTSAFLDPPLTSVRLDTAAIGRAAVARLVEPGPHEPFRSAPALIVRGSTGRAGDGSS